MSGGGQLDLFTLQPTNQNSSPYDSLQHHSARNLRTPTDGNRENGTSQSVPYLSVGARHGRWEGKPYPSIAPRSYRTPNLAVPLYLAASVPLYFILALWFRFSGKW